MALTSSAKVSVFRLLLRLVGLTGLACALVGLFIWLALEEPVGAVVALVGGALALIALALEITGALRFFVSGRGAMGGSVALQVVLALALAVVVNLLGFTYYWRFDLTDGRTFTLPKELRAQLTALRAETDIVVFVRHSSSGVSGETKHDDYDAAAERKIVEKIKDLAEQFQELGPRFRVTVLDIQEKDYKKKLEGIQKESPALAEAITSAPENSIFFQTRGKPAVQRLAFHDVYQLDRQASAAAGKGRGNLVLVSQGVEPFARKVLNIEERKPRIGVAVVHELLGVDGHKNWGIPGVKKVLNSRGYDYVDIILKQWPRGEATVLTRSENAFERLDAQVKVVDAQLKRWAGDKKLLSERAQLCRDKNLSEVNKVIGIVDTIRGELIMDRTALEERRKKGEPIPPIQDLSEQDRRHYLEFLDESLREVESDLKEAEQRRTKLAKEKEGLNVENLAEQRRISDLRAKLNRLLADCDLLILPRLTFKNILDRTIPRLENEAHGLDEAQLEALKDYMKSGRPVLFCLGPANEDSPVPEHDAVESLLEGLGIHLPNQTILFNVEGEALAERATSRIMSGATPDPPPVDLDWPAGAVLGKGAQPDERGKPNPIRTSLKVAGHSQPQDNPPLLRVRHPRPVYYVRMQVPKEAAAGALALAASPELGPLQALSLLAARSTQKIDEGPVFLVTPADCWNEAQPFGVEARPGADRKPPQFDRPKPDDPDKGTLKEERRGPFPIGVAIETELPASWFDKDKSPGKVRVAVVGAGNIFMDDTLNPMKEKLLLDVSNWLLRRDDLLARADPQPWRYPRVELGRQATILWQFGPWLGLPLFFLYLGGLNWVIRGRR